MKNWEAVENYKYFTKTTCKGFRASYKLDHPEGDFFAHKNYNLVFSCEFHYLFYLVYWRSATGKTTLHTHTNVRINWEL